MLGGFDLCFVAQDRVEKGELVCTGEFGGPWKQGYEGQDQSTFLRHVVHSVLLPGTIAGTFLMWPPGHAGHI